MYASEIYWMAHLINSSGYFFPWDFSKANDLFYLKIVLHLFNSIHFVYIFSIFLMVSPFLGMSELQKNMQKLERNLPALRDYSVGVILNH